jgi:hypothetical protein
MLHLPRVRRGRFQRAAVAAAACAAASAGWAADLPSGNPDLELRWDNTLKYSAAWRVKEQSAGLTGLPAAINQDDGDRNFDKGLISNRLDLLTEFDAVYARRYGLRLSGAGWYDQVYESSNDNPGLSQNQTSVPYNEFTAATRRLHGRKVDLLDAFVFAGVDLGSAKLNVRLGRHSLQWGESLFFGANAIAGAMAPVDVIKLQSVPNTQFKEAIRPVPQLSAQLQLTRKVSLGAYYQFQWEANRLPAVGSYFSSQDMLPDGAERIRLGPVLSAPRLADMKPKDRGQGGVQLRFQGDEVDYGLYLVRFHSKSPGPVPVLLSPQAPLPIGYYQVYHQGIVALGASASRTFGDVNVALEGSLRRNQDLASTAGAEFGAVTHDNSGNPAYAVGKTAHLNLSTIWTVPSTPVFPEASLTGEVIWNRTLSVTKNAYALDPKSTRDAYAMRVLFEPTYRQVLPGLDLSVPVGVGYSPRGSRSRALGLALPPENGGDFTLGLNASYLDVWRFSLAYTTFFGAEALALDAANHFNWKQSLKDRDFVAFSVRRSF